MSGTSQQQLNTQKEQISVLTYPNLPVKIDAEAPCVTDAKGGRELATDTFSDRCKNEQIKNVHKAKKS